MQWTVKSCSRTGKCRERIGVRTANAAHRVCAAVLFVIGMNNEEHRERALKRRIWLILELRRLEHHVQEVAFIGEIVIGISVLHANSVTVSKCSNGRDFCYQSKDLFRTTFFIKNVFG